MIFMMRKNAFSILLMMTLVFTVFMFNSSCMASGTSNSWNGNWDTGNTGWGTITLVQTSPGSEVTGSYFLKNEYVTLSGKISGTVSGNVLTGTWVKISDTRARTQKFTPGDFEITMSDDGNRFEGVYYEGSKTGNPPNRAVGTRWSTAAPVPHTTTIDPNDSGCRFSGLKGQIEVMFPGSDEWKLAKMDMVIPVGTHIKTQEDSTAILSFRDQSVFVLKPESEVIVTTPPGPQSKFILVAGQTWANIKRIVKDGEFEIEMNQAVAGIKGTTFVAEVKKDGTSTLKVIEGKVEFTAKADGKKIMVNGGTMVSADKTGLGTPVTFDTAQETSVWEKVKAGAASPSSSGNTVPTQKSPSSMAMIIGAVAVTVGLFKLNRS